MGFLLFSARKLQLKAKMNQLRFRQMQLSQEQQTIASQIADKQQAINAAKNQLGICSQMNVMNSIMTQMSGNSDIQSILTEKGTNIQALLQGASNFNLSADQTQKLQTAYAMAQNQAQMQSAYATNVMNSVLDASSKLELQQLNNKDNEIDMEIQGIESQLKLIEGEYEACKKGEQSEAQSSAPTFGLA